MGALLFPMHRMPCIATVPSSAAREINRWQLRVHVWKEILGTAKRNWYFCACSPLELTFVYACS